MGHHLDRPRATIRRIVETNVRYQVTFLAILSGRADLARTPMVQSVRRGRLPDARGVRGDRRRDARNHRTLRQWRAAQMGGRRARRRRQAMPKFAPHSHGREFRLSSRYRSASSRFCSAPTARCLAASLPVQERAWRCFMRSLVLWGFVVMLKCIGEVHRFSAWRALGSILLIVVAAVVIAGRDDPAFRRHRQD